MRKALTVLLLLVAIIGMAFAADPVPTEIENTKSNSIALITIIGERLPTFNLKASSGSYTVETNPDSTAYFADGNDHTAVTELTLAGDISRKSISQVFEIFSDAKANYTGEFEFVVQATAFRSQIAEGSTSPAYTTKGNITYVYEKADMSTDEKNVSVTADQGRIIATFSGPQVNTNVKIGQITVIWPRDPAAVSGEYESDVIMTVKLN